MTTRNAQQANREAESRLVQYRVQNAQKHLGNICETVGSIVRKSARLRDKGDLLASRLTAYAESNHFNSSSCYNIKRFAENYAVVQDYSDTKVKRMEAKVLKPLMRYGELCKYMKKTVHSDIAASGKEKKVFHKLQKLQQKPHNSQLINQTQLELERVQDEKRMCAGTLQVEIERFEFDRLLGIKKILTELVKIEMVYHAKALEYLSKCFENAQQINIEADLSEFQAAALQAEGRYVGGDSSSRSQQLHTGSPDPVYAVPFRRSTDPVTSSRLSSPQSRQPIRVRISEAS
ncbi:protein FAM92A-A-like isoform X2 [Pomacea canaliculata]|uniref:protein FAM92A-A-like isoform X2 n=1 Tax=Pomacea canaliculata TaxID=400727 RepID=UPI000D7311E5|nr:protein FAM92A-A-like isoform X2 [Pomacea canaliculata]